MTERQSIEALYNRRLSRSEAEAYLSASMTDTEREEILALVRWFTRRYPTALERLAYVRRAYARWQKALPNRRSF